MTKVITSKQTVEAPVLVKCPYTGESVNVRPFLFLLSEFDDHAKRLDHLIFFLIEGMSSHAMEYHHKELKDFIYDLYRMRNMFGQMGGTLAFDQWSYSESERVAEGK